MIGVILPAFGMVAQYNQDNGIENHQSEDS